MTITLFHTVDLHRATFERLRDEIAPGEPLRHVVRADWLARAQDGMDQALIDEIATAVKAEKGRVLCTCTTIGVAAEDAGAIRVDWPMMQAAARAGGPVMMAYCLDSTYAPSMDLLDRALAEGGVPRKVYPLMLSQYWPLFEAGEADAFASVLAGEIRQMVADKGDVAAVVIAQASMAGAAARLGDLGIPVLTSPELALRAVLGAD